MPLSSLWKSAKILRAQASGDEAVALVQAYYDAHFHDAKWMESVTPAIGIDILKIASFPEPGQDTFLTKGMSRYELKALRDGAARRAEYAITVLADAGYNVPHVLAHIAKACVAELRSLGAGGTFQYPFAQEWHDETITVAGVFAWSGVWLADQPLVLGASRGVEIDLLELIPITQAELHDVKNHLEDFIGATATGEIDLMDFRRKPKAPDRH